MHPGLSQMPHHLMLQQLPHLAAAVPPLHPLPLLLLQLACC
jgi:hypothetical protein